MKKRNSKLEIRRPGPRVEKLPLEMSLPPMEVNSIENARLLIAELQARKLELELQNEKLHRIQEQLASERERYADLYNFAPVAYFTFDERDIILDLNLAAAELLGDEPKSLIGHSLSIYIPADSLQTFIGHRQLALETKLPQVCELNIRLWDGKTVYVHVQTAALDTESNSIQLWRSVMTDITQRKQQEEKTKYQEYLLDAVYDAIIATDNKLRITQWNKAAEELYGWTEAEVLGKSIDTICQTEFLNIDQAEAQADLLSRKFWRGELRQRKRDGSELLIMASVTLLEDAEGNPIGGVTINHDISERKRTEKELRESNAHLEATLDALPDLMFEADREGRILNFHVSRPENLRLLPENLLSKTIGQIFPISASQPIYEALTQAIEQGNSFGAMYSMPSPRGVVWYELSIAAVGDPKLEDARFIVLARDITERKKNEDDLTQANEILQSHVEEIESLHMQLREQTIRDPLTGLFNRRYLQETLEREIARSKREEKSVGFIIMDLDHFKLINDTFGHKAGDELLQKLGLLITENLRMGDIPCRYGGEEFTIVMPGASLQATLDRAKLLSKKIAAMQILHNAFILQITTSVGVAVYPEHGESGEEVLIHADRALYHAKESGRNRIVVYQASIDSHMDYSIRDDL